MKNSIQFCLLIIILFSINGCKYYNFTGTGKIDANTFQVNYFQNNAELIEPGIERDFTLALQDLIQNEPELKNIAFKLLVKSSDTNFTSMIDFSIIGNSLDESNYADLTNLIQKDKNADYSSLGQLLTKNIQFAKCFVGIFISYWLFGIIQEWITRSKYGDNKERFTFTYCLVFVQCVANTIISKIMSNVPPPRVII